MSLEQKSLNRKYASVLWLCWFAYTISYIGRQAYNTNIQNIITSYGLTKGLAGYPSSAFFFCYGAGQLINGLICEKVNSRQFVSFALILSSVISVSMFFISNIIGMTILWGLNGFVLSALWCNLIKIISKIKNDVYVKKSVIVMSLTVPIGTVIAYGLSFLLTSVNLWVWYYIIAAVVMLGGSLVFMFALKSKNTAIQKAEAEVYREEVKAEEFTKKTKGMGLLKFLSFAIIPFFIMTVISSIVKDGSISWLPSFLADLYSLENSYAILITLIVPLFGIVASVLAKFTVKKTNDIFITSMIFFIIGAALTAVLVLVYSLGAVIPNGVSVVLAVLLFGFINVAMHTVNTTLTSILPLYYKDKLESGKSAGIINCFCYVGSTLSTFGLGYVVDAFSWDTYIYVFLCMTAFAGGLCLLGYFMMKKRNLKPISQEPPTQETSDQIVDEKKYNHVITCSGCGATFGSDKKIKRCPFCGKLNKGE